MINPTWLRWIPSILVLAISITSITTAHATNGLFLIGWGAKSRAMGGTAIANPQGMLSSASNPAVLGLMRDRMDIGAALFRPRSYARLGDLTVASGAKLVGSSADNLFIMPSMAGGMKLSRKISAGMSMIPAGGGGVYYSKNLFNNAATPNPDPNEVAKPLEVELYVMQINPTISYKLNKQHILGATLVIGAQRFRAQGLEYFTTFTRSLTADTLSGRGFDWAGGLGLRVGWIGKFLKKKLLLGAVATSKVYMSKFKKYNNLFPESGDMDTPANLGVGASYRVTKKFTVALDITRTFYKDTAGIGNAAPTTGGLIFQTSKKVNGLGLDEGIGFGWNDQTVYKLGFAYKYNKKWTMRAGWNYGKSPIPEDTGAILINMVAPATTQNHLTLGGTYKLSGISEVNFAYVHAFEFKQNGPTYIGKTGEISMYQDSISVGLGMRM